MCKCKDNTDLIKLYSHRSRHRPVASSPSENQVQAGDDSLPVHAQIGTDVLGGRLSGNLCHWWQVTPTVRWHRDTVNTKNWGWGVSWSQVKLSGTVYQPPCKPQLSPIDVHCTSESPPVQLIDSTSEDHLWCALHIYASSSSSPSITFVSWTNQVLSKLFFIWYSHKQLTSNMRTR